MKSESLAGVAVGVAGIAALVAIFAIMADCSKTVARVNAEGVNCVSQGGRWEPSDYGDSYCVMQRRT